MCTFTAQKHKLQQMNGETNIYISYSPENHDWVDDGGEFSLIPWLKEQLADRNINFRTDSDFSTDVDVTLLLLSQEYASCDPILDDELPRIKEASDKGLLKIAPFLLSDLSEFGKEELSWIFDRQALLPLQSDPLIYHFTNETERENILTRIKEALIELVTVTEDEIDNWVKMGDKYYYAVGNVLNDNESAMYWYRKAGEYGNPEAQTNLGWMCEYGQGLEKENYQEAVAWYTKAAKQGHASAQYCLAEMYHSGCGVAQDYPKALEWYHKAADQGNMDAIIALKKFRSGI
jgi:tetratricopeptide (TPR) repeat protein